MMKKEEGKKNEGKKKCSSDLAGFELGPLGCEEWV